MIFHDAHNHLQDPALAPYREEILARGGAGEMVVNGTGEHDWEAVAHLAAAHRWIRPSYGVHPWRVDEVTPAWRERLAERLDAGGFVGEIGLDRGKGRANFGRQMEVFVAQWEEAGRRGIPATIHCVRAWGGLEAVLAGSTGPARGFLLHAYGGPAEMVRRFAERGAYFSFSGAFLGDGGARRREVFRDLPIERLLVETDAPAMPLPPGRERRPVPRSGDGAPVNHPDNLVAAYEGLAELRGMPVAELSEIVAGNHARLFGA